MSSIIIYGALMRARDYQPGPPLTPKERKVVTVLVIVGTIALVVLGVFAWRSISAYNARVDQLHQEWDAGQGHPASNKIELGKTVTVKATTGPINDDWASCGHKTCRRSDFAHYPLVMPIGNLSLNDDGCYTDESDVSVDTVMASSSRPDAYSIALAADGKSIKICPIGPRQEGDELMVWSDAPTAVR